MDIKTGKDRGTDEAIIDPDQIIIDAHHHIYDRPDRIYRLPDLWADTQSGHRVVKTVFVQCRGHYREDGPEHLRPAGETEFIADVARQSNEDPDKAQIAAIVPHADLTLGERVEALLDEHERVGRGLFRGIRQCAAHDPHEELSWVGGQVEPGLYGRSEFLTGLRVLGRRGLSFDAWHFHHQMQDFIRVVRSVPETTFVLDHFGTPLGVGPYEGKRDEIMSQLRKDLAELARCPNVNAKLGGLAMLSNGYGWDRRQSPVSSDEMVAAQRDIYLHTIDCFGPDRCMFESNFPVDKVSVSYRVLWNAFKKMAAGFNADERDQLFRGTAARVYRLD
jgi:predicted TIM-barrel fold metal-dependent hydrolase